MYLKYQPAFGKIQTQFTGILAGIIGATCYNKFKSVKLPAGALAMYHCANKNKKKVVYGLLLAGSISAFFTGVTEPLEFAFMFLAPGLYFIHAVLSGISAVICTVLPVRVGFVDWVLSFKAPMAEIILEGLGGKENIISIDNCVTRLRLEIKDKYKINERITTLSYEAHAKYTHKAWFIAAKSVLGSNLTQASGLGGFGIKSVDEHTGEQKYTPIRFSSSWLNVVYGKKWKPGIFVGYAKNLGTSDALYAPDGTDAQVYGTGTNLDQLVTAGAELTYNVPHWKFGLEYTLSSAWYGSLNASNGKIRDTHAVCNNRIVAVAMFMF